MRIDNKKAENSTSEVSIYLTTNEAARLYAMLGSMLRDVRVQDFSVSDESIEHTLHFYLQTGQRPTEFDRRLPDSIHPES